MPNSIWLITCCTLCPCTSKLRHFSKRFFRLSTYSMYYVLSIVMTTLLAQHEPLTVSDLIGKENSGWLLPSMPGHLHYSQWVVKLQLGHTWEGEVVQKKKKSKKRKPKTVELTESLWNAASITGWHTQRLCICVSYPAHFPLPSAHVWCWDIHTWACTKDIHGSI